MKLIIFATLIVFASALEDDISSKIKDKRQVLLGGLGYGGLAYPYGLGAYPYGGVYPGFGVIGRKRREVAEDIEEVDDEAKEKRQVLLGGYGLGYGLPYAGYPLGLGYGLGGYPAVIGRKRRDVAEVEESEKEKRHLLLGHGVLPVAGYGYGLPIGGYGYGLGLGAVDTGFGVPAVYGRKRRDVAEVEEAEKEKRQILLGGYGLGYGLPYAGYPLGLGYGLGGYPAVIGRKRREVEDVADKAAHEKRQIVGGVVGGVVPAVGGVVPAVGGVYPGVVGAYPGVVGAYPGVVGAYPAVGGVLPVGGVVGAPGVIL